MSNSNATGRLRYLDFTLLNELQLLGINEMLSNYDYEEIQIDHLTLLTLITRLQFN